MGNRVGPGQALFDSVVAAQQALTSTAKTDRIYSESIQAIKARQGENGVIRDGWFMTTTEWINSAQPRGIYWNANPSDVSWKMGQRSAHSRNLYGTVLHVWPDSHRGTFYDEFRLTLSLQSGNLMPVYVTNEGYKPSGGITNFYDLMQLIDAPKLTLGTAANPPRANLVYIQYSSTLFPQLMLIGMFDSEGITFTDSSSAPSKVSAWSVSFIVYDTSPRLSSSEGSQQTNSAMLAKWVEQCITKSILKT
jgi:hypothetical protein